MKAVAVQFPSDLDVQTLYAESMMNLNAWRLWTSEGKAASAQLVDANSHLGGIRGVAYNGPPADGS